MLDFEIYDFEFFILFGKYIVFFIVLWGIAQSIKFIR